MYLRVNTIMNKAQKKGTKFVKPDAIFLPKRGRRVLNKPVVSSKSPKRAKQQQQKDENVAPCPNLLDSQCSIASFLFESQNGGCASSQHGCASSQHYDGDTEDGISVTTTPLSSPMKKNLSPLTPQNLSLTQESANQSPCPPIQSSQVSPCASSQHGCASPQHYDGDTEDGISVTTGTTTFKSMLPMVQSVLSSVAEAADFPIVYTDKQLTEALSRAVTAAQRLHDAIVAAM